MVVLSPRRPPPSATIAVLVLALASRPPESAAKDIEAVAGKLSNHYDPRSKTLRLSEAASAAGYILYLGLAGGRALFRKPPVKPPV